jgi:drug/metabolite transporter (DMT)-like permease
MATQNTAPHFLKGMTLVLLAVLLFACIDTVAKYLLTKFNVPLVAGIRYGLNLVFLVALMAPRHGSNLWKTQRTGLVMVRGLSLAAATFFASLALQRMPVGETVAILYLQGFAVMLAAGYFLGERVGLPGWLAAVMGFTGVLLIARPGGALAPLGVVFALLGAAVSVVYVLLSRSLATTESTMAMLLHVAVAGSVVFGVMLVFNWQSFAFTWTDIALLVFMGAASLAAHFLFTSAYRFAPASMLAPFSYVHIAITTVLSWLVYAHVPDGYALIGMAMIGVSGAAIAVYSHMSRGAVAS